MGPLTRLQQLIQEAIAQAQAQQALLDAARAAAQAVQTAVQSAAQVVGQPAQAAPAQQTDQAGGQPAVTPGAQSSPSSQSEQTPPRSPAQIQVWIDIEDSQTALLRARMWEQFTAANDTASPEDEENDTANLAPSVQAMQTNEGGIWKTIQRIMGNKGALETLFAEADNVSEETANQLLRQQGTGGLTFPLSPSTPLQGNCGVAPGGGPICYPPPPECTILGDVPAFPPHTTLLLPVELNWQYDLKYVPGVSNVSPLPPKLAESLTTCQTGFVGLVENLPPQLQESEAPQEPLPVSGGMATVAAAGFITGFGTTKTGEDVRVAGVSVGPVPISAVASDTPPETGIYVELDFAVAGGLGLSVKVDEWPPKFDLVPLYGESIGISFYRVFEWK